VTLARLQQQAPSAIWTAGRDAMTGDANVEQERARRFRDAALPHLDDVYTLARYLMRNPADADDAVQECYLRALRHFDSYRGPAMKPWLLTILKNVCYAEFARRGKQETPTDFADAAPAASDPIWQEPQATPESALLRRQDDATIRRLVEQLPTPFRETIVLREINDLSYQEIAAVAGVPVGTVMSRLARARAMLRAAWSAANGAAPVSPTAAQAAAQGSSPSVPS
jgi:RNA polymerase sigma-70 factor (ECF subfamily)